MNIIFRDEGFDVVVSNTGAAAEHLELIHPDLILLDVRIVGYKKRGNEICAEIRKQYPPEKLPVILVSAESDIETLAAGCGANGYIRKPFDITELSNSIKHLLATR
jgi:two-component system response regulator VicR